MSVRMTRRAAASAVRCCGARRFRAPVPWRGGFVLAVLLVLALTIMIAGGAHIRMAGGEAVTADRHMLAVQTFYTAEAGVHYAEAYLLGQAELSTSATPIVLGEQSLGQGSYNVTIYPDARNATDYVKRFQVVSTGAIRTAGGAVVRATKTITADLQTETFAKFAYFTNGEYAKAVQDTVWFATGDVVHGPIHTNSQFHIAGSPVFHGRVSSTAPTFDFANGGYPNDNPDFRVGYSLGTPEISMTNKDHLRLLENEAKKAGLHIKTQAVEVQFNATGTITYRQYQGSWGNWQTVALPPNGIIYCTGNATVYGTVSGRATVAVPTGSSIFIPSDIVYKGDPSDPACTDSLGLIAGQAVTITKSGPPGADMTIHATIMAFDSYLWVNNYASIPLMGKLTIYGGVIGKHRGPIAEIDKATGMRISGFSKDYRFDYRSIAIPPPYFPGTGRFDLVGWQEGPLQFASRLAS